MSLQGKRPIVPSTARHQNKSTALRQRLPRRPWFRQKPGQLPKMHNLQYRRPRDIVEPLQNSKAREIGTMSGVRKTSQARAGNRAH